MTLQEGPSARGTAAARTEPLPEGPSRRTASGDLPLFAEGDAAYDERPLVTPAAKPRPPLAVRRATPDLARVRARIARATIEEAPILDLGPVPSAVADPDDGPVAPVEPAERVADHDVAATRFARALAGLIDMAILGAIDAGVIYFTLKLCGLTFAEIHVLPLAPLIGFFLVLNGGYLVAFTAAGGQTIGKMATGIRVVGELGEPVGVGQAVFRTAAYLVSALPAGLGFLPAFIGAHRRALHDRLAETRVVRA